MVVQELFAKLGLELDQVGFEEAEKVLHNLHHGFVAFGAAAAAALAVGAAGLAKATADAAVAASRLAQSTGLDLETVQEFGFAASTAGVSTDEMAVALSHLAKTGIKDVKKEMLELSERFHGMPDSASARAEKVRISMEKFGRSGRALVPLLNRGKEAIEELAEEAKDLGLVFNEEDVAAGITFKKSLHEIEATFKGLGFAIGRLVLPVVNKFMQAVTHLLHVMRTGAPWVHGLVLALKTMAFVLGGVLLTALFANAAAIASAVAGYIAMGAAATVAALQAAAAWLIAAAPALLLVAAFTALLLVLDDVRGYLNGEDSLIGELGPKWTKFLDDFLRPNAEDPWWLTALKDGIANVRRLIGYAQDLEGTLNSAFKAIGFQNNITRGDSSPGAYWTQADIDAKRQQMFHGGASAPAAVNSSGGGAAIVHAPVSIHIAPSPGASAGDIADAVHKRIQDHHVAALREAAEAHR